MRNTLSPWMRLLVAVTLAAMLAVVAFPATAHSSPYNKNNLISNKEFTKIGMKVKPIQRFLNGRRGVLADYSEDGRSAAQIIYDAAAKHRISSRLILVMLQKEQGLLTNPNPSQYNLDWAMGCGVGNSTYRGFAAQVDCGAKFLRTWYNAGKPNSAIAGAVPENKATWALYKYGPSVEGNKLFWKVWEMYWGH